MSDNNIKEIPIELQVYTLQETADILKCTKRAIYNWIKEGKIKASKIGRDYKITATEIKRVIEEGIE